MINKVTLIGNAGKDPEVRNLDSGAVVAKFSLATNENYKDKAGEWQTQTEWHNIIAWRFLAERAQRNITKGKLVYVEGKLTHRSYTDKDGVERRTTEIVASQIRVLERREGSGGSYDNSGFPSQESSPQPVSPAQPQPISNDDEDDLPF